VLAHPLDGPGGGQQDHGAEVDEERELEGMVHHRPPIPRKLHPANRPWQAGPMTILRAAFLAPILASLALPIARAQEASPAPAPEGAPATTAPTTPAAADPAPPPLGNPRLTVDLKTAAIVTGAELGLIGLSLAFKDQLAPPTCRWCDPPQLDKWARGRLVWSNPSAANTASDAMELLVPAAAATTLWIQAAPQGQREVVEDLVVLTESATTCILLTQIMKYSVARLRQDAWARGTIETRDDVLSYWSGHTSFAFSAAAAATQISRLRGRSGWQWLAVATFGAAAVTGYLRVAADRHWLTDVVTGAMAGTATGLVVPLLAFQPADAPRPLVTLAPAPGGLALLF
jgi:membrane-associated phospholipid phosphatase